MERLGRHRVLYQHRYFQEAVVSEKVFKDNLQNYLIESGVAEYDVNDAFALAVLKRCLHGEMVDCSTDYRSDRVNFEGLHGEAMRASLAAYSRPDLTQFPDSMVFGKPLHHNNGALIYPFDQNYNAYPEYEEKIRTHNGVRGSWYACEITCTRGSVWEVINRKSKKVSTEGLIIVHWGFKERPMVRIADMVEVSGQFSREVCILTNSKIPLLSPEEYKMMFDRALKYHMTLKNLDHITENRMNNEILGKPPPLPIPGYTFSTLEINREDMMKELWAKSLIDEELYELKLAEHVDFETRDCRYKLKETYLRTVAGLQFPLFNVGRMDLFQMLRDITWGAVILPGKHWGIKMSSLPPVLAAQTVIQNLKDCIAVMDKGETLKRDDKLLVDPRYLIGKMPKNYLSGKGLSKKEDKNLKVQDGHYKENKIGFMGESTFIRMAAMSPQVEVDVIDDFFEEYCERYPETRAKAEVRELIKLCNRNEMMIKANMFRNVAGYALQAVGNLKEKKGGNEVPIYVMPITIGEGESRIMIGYWFQPQAHIRKKEQKYFTWAVYFGTDDPYVGEHLYTSCRLTHTYLNSIGFTRIFIQATWSTRKQLLDMKNSTEIATCAIGDYGDYLHKCQVEGLVANLTDVYDKIRARMAIYYAWYYLDCNYLQGASSHCTKLMCAVKSKESGGTPYIMCEEWWNPLYTIEHGIEQEFCDIFMDKAAEVYQGDKESLRGYRWSDQDSAELTGTLLQGIPVQWDFELIDKFDSRFHIRTGQILTPKNEGVDLDNIMEEDRVSLHAESDEEL